MIIQLLLFVVLFPLADLVLLLVLARFIGPWVALGLAACSALAGVWLARRQWRQLGAQAQQRLAKNEIPSDLASEAMLVVLTAGLLITPGLLTDLVGLSLLLPRCRRWYQKRILNWLRTQFRISVFRPGSGPRRGPVGDDVFEGEFRDTSPPPSSQPPSLEDRTRGDV
jgi:UPF0716 protein FxsA